MSCSHINITQNSHAWHNGEIILCEFKDSRLDDKRVYMYMHMYVYIYINMYLHMYTYIYTHIWRNTHQNNILDMSTRMYRCWRQISLPQLCDIVFLQIRIGRKMYFCNNDSLQLAYMWHVFAKLTMPQWKYFHWKSGDWFDPCCDKKKICTIFRVLAETLEENRCS